MSDPSYPSIEVRVTIAATEIRAFAVIDTGFDGFLAIPSEVAADLPPPDSEERAEMANGLVVDVPMFLGELELLEAPGPFAATVIAVGDDYLLGLSALRRFRVTFDHGERLLVER